MPPCAYTEVQSVTRMDSDTVDNVRKISLTKQLIYIFDQSLIDKDKIG